MTRLVVGLGNPGKEYEDTRHNVGARVLAILARKFSEGPDGFTGFKREARFKARSAEGKIGRDKVILMRPDTYMNESGQAVQPAAQFRKVEPRDIIVIFDDKDLPLGSLRIRPGGSAGGHNGMRSVIERLGTEEVPRVRVGIGTERGRRADAAGFVLGKFSPGERVKIRASEKLAAEAVETILREGLEAAMNKYNER